MGENIKEFIATWSARWLIIGLALVQLANAGIAVPGWAIDLFSEDLIGIISGFVNNAIEFIGLAIAAWNALRAMFNATEPAPEVASLSAAHKKRLRKAFGPMKAA